MVYEFKFPDVGEGLTEGKLVKWTVKVGDSIKTDDTIADVETDKAVVNIPSPVSGTVIELLFKDGDTLTVGEVIMKIDESGSTPQPPTPGNVQVPEPEKEPSPEESLTLDVGDKVITEVPKKKEQEQLVDIKAEIKKLEVIGGDVSAQETQEKVLEEKPKPEPAKVEVEEVKEVPQKVETSIQESKPSVHEGGILAMPNVRKEARDKNIDLNSVTPSGKNGQITMRDLGGGSQVKETPKTVETKVEEVKTETPKTNHVTLPPVGKDILATPSVRKKARELEIDINTVKGSGENGSILLEDLTKKNVPQETSEIQQETKVEDQVIETQTATVESLTEDTRVPIQGIRAIISQRMLESKQKTASVTMHDEVDVTKLVELRAKHKDELKERGVKLTYLPFFVKAYVAATKKYPLFNALVDDEKQEVVQKAAFNVGIAADTPKGLLVPVVENVEHKSILTLANEINDVASQAKEGTLTPQKMQGGTFSISSLGALGGTYFTPIIDYPQTAILGIGKIEKKPVVENGGIIVKDVVYLSLTFDHRIMDGADAARFMKELTTYLKEPEMMFMEMD